jgi:hypothetical protein
MYGRILACAAAMALGVKGGQVVGSAMTGCSALLFKMRWDVPRYVAPYPYGSTVTRNGCCRTKPAATYVQKKEEPLQ